MAVILRSRDGTSQSAVQPCAQILALPNAPFEIFFKTYIFFPTDYTISWAHIQLLETVYRQYTPHHCPPAGSPPGEGLGQKVKFPTRKLSFFTHIRCGLNRKHVFCCHWLITLSSFDRRTAGFGRLGTCVKWKKNKKMEFIAISIFIRDSRNLRGVEH